MKASGEPAESNNEYQILCDSFASWLKGIDSEGNALDSALNDRLGLRRCWIDMAGDHAGGTMLAQIAYWCLMPSKANGKSKLTIEKHDRQWLAKSNKEWWEECRLSRTQVTRLLKKFKAEGWIITKLMRFNGSPTTHISVELEFLFAWQAAVDYPATLQKTPFE